MFSRILGSIGLSSLLLTGFLPAQAQFNITGVTDKATPYVNTVTFTVGTQSGFTYSVFLNQRRIPTDVPITLNEPDFYEINAYATNVATGGVSSRWVRFIVRSSERGGTEWGLPPHVPSPATPSAAAEFAGAQLRLIAPENFPTGYEIPVVAWVVNEQNRAVRVNGSLAAAGHSSIVIKRGVGSGFLAANNPAGPLNYAPQLPGLQTNRSINLEDSTTWTSISGTLSGTTSWPDNSRIRVTGHISVPAGSTLTVGAGTIVQLNPGVNITNNGSVLINGTVERPVVFMPQSRAQPWGGFFMRTSTGLVNATGTIFTGSGADPSGGAGHRPEQCLFLVDSAPRITLTDCAAIYLAGQFGHAYGGGTFNLTRFLLQRATTGGEYTGASFTVNDSAFIEFPDDTANYVDGDNDALYFVSGSHSFTNTLFGWTKDDGIDSGGSGYGPLTYQSCWFESTFHEGNSLSGFKNVFSRDTVYIDCGQGIENGYDGPTNRMEHCLFLGNKVGLRHGDNYPDIGSYNGREIATNCISIFNYRDVFGFNWRTGTGNGWTNATGQMTIISNWLSAPNAYFPLNSIWDPPVDAGLLSSFMSTPANAAVGSGFAVRSTNFAMSTIFQGVPVRLSSFTTNPVTVNYRFDGCGVGFGGALTFEPGETVKRIRPTGFDVAAVSRCSGIRLRLVSAVNGEITGLAEVSFTGVVAGPQVACRVPGTQIDLARLPEGIPLALTTPGGLPVTVNYSYDVSGATLASGVVTFAPGETLTWAPAPAVDLADIDLVRFRITEPTAATLANPDTVYLVKTAAAPPSENVTFIPRGSRWRYRDVASAASAGWQNLGFDHNTWPEGPAQLGFSNNEENDEATLIADNDQITSYFRRGFNVADSNAFSGLSLWMLRDDAGVVYLNGTEIFRSPNLPAPPTLITYNTTSGSPNGENTIDTATTNRNSLRTGTNVVAVEIHQQGATSSDVSFDFELIGIVAPAAVPQGVYVGVFDAQFAFAWGDPNFSLQQTDQLQGENTIWTTVPGTSPVFITPNPGDPQRFYRLRKP